MAILSSPEILDIIASAVPHNGVAIQTCFRALQVSRAWYTPFRKRLLLRVDTHTTRLVYPRNGQERLSELLQQLEADPTASGLVKQLSIIPREERFLHACSISLRRLHIEGKREEVDHFEPFHLPVLRDFACSALSAELVGEILRQSPNMQVVVLGDVDLRASGPWETFSFITQPHIKRFAVQAAPGVSQAFLERVIRPLAPALRKLEIRVRTVRGTTQVKPYGAGTSLAWWRFEDTNFPCLKDLQLGGISRIGVRTLLRGAAQLESLTIVFTASDYDAISLLKQLPATLQRLTMVEAGLDTAFAATYAQCVVDRAWMPMLAAAPHIGDIEGLDDQEKEKLLDGLTEGLQARGLTASRKDIVRETIMR